MIVEAHSYNEKADKFRVETFQADNINESANSIIFTLKGDEQFRFMKHHPYVSDKNLYIIIRFKVEIL